jgi:hypothetical protein
MGVPAAVSKIPVSPVMDMVVHCIPLLKMLTSVFLNHISLIIPTSAAQNCKVAKHTRLSNVFTSRTRSRTAWVIVLKACRLGSNA